jgi:hypothetical protein
METLSKAKRALKTIMDSIGRNDIFEKIMLANGRKQKNDVAAFAFKALASELPKSDMGAVRQLHELVAQVQDDDLKEQLETIMQELFTPEKTKGLPFYQTTIDSPKPFDWKQIKQHGKGTLFSRMFRGKR